MTRDEHGERLAQARLGERHQLVVVTLAERGERFGGGLHQAGERHRFCPWNTAGCLGVDARRWT